MNWVDLLSDREKATALWAGAFSVLCLIRPELRAAVLAAAKMLVHPKIAASLAVMLAYVAGAVALLHRAHVWDILLAKDTLVWVVGTAVVYMTNAAGSTSTKQLRSLLLDSLKVVIVLEFVISLYTFSLWVEIALVPLAVLLTVVSGVASRHGEYAPFGRAATAGLGIVGSAVVARAIHGAFAEWPDIASADNLRMLALPPTLTLLYWPFLYAFALVTAYEDLFARLGHFLRDDADLARFAKWRIFAMCHVSLTRLHGFVQISGAEFLNLRSRQDVRDMVRRFRTQQSGAKT